jgi:hypothetical protein
VSGFRPWKSKPVDLETALRSARPAPRDEYVRGLTREIRAGRAPRRMRLGFAAVFTAAILGALSAVGGLGYAASATTHAAHAVKNVVVKSKTPTQKLRPAAATPAQAQYRPGCGLGDANHIHTGPPGQGGVCPANSPKNQP